MDPLLVVILIVVGLTVLVALLVIVRRLKNKERDEPLSLEEIELSSPFSERVVKPIIHKLSELLGESGEDAPVPPTESKPSFAPLPASQPPDTGDIAPKGAKEKKRDADDVDADDSFWDEQLIAPGQQSFGEVGAALPSVVSDEMSERDKEEIAADDLPRDYFPAMESADEESDEGGEEWDNWSVEGSSGRGIAEESAEEAEEDIAFAAAPEPEPSPPPASEPKRRKRQESEAEEAAESVPGLSRGFVNDAPKAPKTEIHQSVEDAEQVTQIGVVEGDVNITYETPKADTQFAAYYPEQVAPDEWQPLFTYIYKDLAFKHVQDDVLEQQRQHDDVKLDSEFKPAKVAVPQGARITAALDLPGFEIETPDPITFFKDWHRLDFRIRAVSAPHNAPVMGHLTFHSDHDGLPLLVAEIFFEVRVGEAVAAGVSEAVVNMFSFIYCSLSDADLPVYERLKAAYELMDIQYLRSEGVQQREVLLALLSQADKFHLLWSNAAAESAQVQQELRLAFELAQQRAHFIRPVYWEQPRPPVPDELADIDFDYKPQLAG